MDLARQTIEGLLHRRLVESRHGIEEGMSETERLEGVAHRLLVWRARDVG